MTKIILLAAIVLATAAHAQQRTIYDANGRVVRQIQTDSQGSTTIYDASGNVTGRTSTSGNTTTIYDTSGRNVGRTTK
jgi:YD repeat-containing protein